MGKKKNKGFYSTNPDFSWDSEDEEVESIEPSEQNLRIFLDRKKRKGKEVSLVAGFEGPEEDLKELGKLLKSKLGVGGSVKEGEILIQGNHRNKILEILKEKGFSRSKIAGGG